MTLRHDSPAAPVFRPALMADLARYGVRFNPEGVQPPADPKPADPKPADPKPADPKPVDPKDDPAAALRAELERVKRERDAFGDATPAEIAELRKVKAEADKLRADAAAAKAKEEEEKLRREGNFDALKQQMADRHKEELTAAEKRAVELQQIADDLQNQMRTTSIMASFAGSTFIAKDTVLSASKAKLIYGSHVEMENGQAVVYDAPTGSKVRSKIVDARGNPLPFDDAMRRVIEADPDRDNLLRAQQKPGSGQKPAGVKPQPTSDGPTGLDRIRMGIGQLRKGPGAR